VGKSLRQKKPKRGGAEGKNKMSVLNAVRNKLVLRVFSCDKNNRMFEKNINIHLFES
jgi:hypothetical protein